MFSKVWYHVPMFGVAPLTFGNTTFYEKFAYITYQAYRLNDTWHAWLFLVQEDSADKCNN